MGPPPLKCSASKLSGFSQEGKDAIKHNATKNCPQNLFKIDHELRFLLVSSIASSRRSNASAWEKCRNHEDAHRSDGPLKRDHIVLYTCAEKARSASRRSCLKGKAASWWKAANDTDGLHLCANAGEGARPDVLLLA